MSLYFENSVKITYGENQKAFQRQGHLAVAEIVGLIRKGVSEELFPQVVELLSWQRLQAALAQGTDESEKFGLRRDANWIESYTSLSERYGMYGSQLLQRVHQYFEEAAAEKHGWPKKPFKKELEPCLGRRSSIEMTFIGWNCQEAVFPYRTIEDIQKIYRLCDRKLPQYFIRQGDIYFQRFDALSELLLDRKSMEKLSQKSLEDYQKLRVTLNIMSAQRRDNIPADANWVLLNHYLEINQRMALVSQTLFECSPNPSTPCGFECFHATAIHQDPLLLNTTLQDVSGLFQEALKWDKSTSSRNALQETVGLIMYEWAHATPFLRGSAATGEWLEQAIYKSLGFLAHEYDNKRSANLEALVLPPKEFIDVYPGTIRLFDEDDLIAEQEAVSSEDESLTDHF